MLYGEACSGYIRHKQSLQKVQECIAVNGYSHFTATGRHWPYGITEGCLLPDTSERATARALTPASKLVLALPTPEGWKAELT